MLRSHDLYEAEATSLPTRNSPASASPFASAVPPGFLKLTGRLQQRFDRALGYFGQSRFVFFYFEPRGEEVVWNDGQSYGFATGAWCEFGEKVIPLARICGAHVGDADRKGDHVLLIDRITGHSWFAPRDAAQHLVAAQ
jgi:hypothetical protein